MSRTAPATRAPFARGGKSPIPTVRSSRGVSPRYPSFRVTARSPVSASSSPGRASGASTTRSCTGCARRSSTRRTVSRSTRTPCRSASGRSSSTPCTASASTARASRSGAPACTTTTVRSVPSRSPPPRIVASGYSKRRGSLRFAARTTRPAGRCSTRATATAWSSWTNWATSGPGPRAPSITRCASRTIGAATSRRWWRRMPITPASCSTRSATRSSNSPRPTGPSGAGASPRRSASSTAPGSLRTASTASSPTSTAWPRRCPRPRPPTPTPSWRAWARRWRS
ncbi:hypothetical protein SRABI128_02322 [Microbacterium sp. Bi128]|nr:hypothetical protein SRABI128_02322 [Microbacterium sp. Bi128]